MKTSKNSLPRMLSIVLSSMLLASCADPEPNDYHEYTEYRNFRIYPDMQRNIVHVGDTVVFEFDPEDKNINMNALQIDTGELGKSVLRCGYNISCKGNNVRVRYKYKKAGYYNVEVQYQGNTVAMKKIIIVKNYLTDQELYYEAVKRVAKELQKGIKQVAATKVNPKFAVSSLREANFEYKESNNDVKDVEIVYGLMQALVEMKNKEQYSAVEYAILERAPQALVRLAHESLWRVNPDDPTGRDMIRQAKQEYGLLTRYYEPEVPFVYAIELAGVKDTRSSKGKGDSTEKVVPPSVSRGSSVQKSAHFHQESHTNRPFMFAQFDTADFLVVIDRIDDTPSEYVVERSNADYYDTTYNAKAIKRMATVKVNARILDENGQIMWVKNISKQVSDLVLSNPNYSPPPQRWEDIKRKRSKAKARWLK